MNKITLVSIMLCAVTVPALAADDPNIQGKLREDIHSAMKEHIALNMENGFYTIYDAVDNDVKRLRFKALHNGIVKKQDFYVSCADFVSDGGTKFDLDILVMQHGERLHAIQGLVHSINGQKRKYRLEIFEEQAED